MSGAPAPARAPGSWATAWLVAACALLLLPSLGLYPLFNDDEGAFSEATRELLESGDWLSTTLNGAPRFDKPILIYWLQAASVRAFGLNEFALRLPSALAALAWMYAIARFAGERWGSDRGVRAAWIGVTSLGVLAMARAATADALLNALIAASLLDLWRSLEPAAGEAPGARQALRRSYVWIGLGLLAKGPIAALIPAAVSLAYCLSAPARGGLRRWARLAFDPLGWTLLLLVAAPWYLAQWQLHGRAFVEGFLVHHNLARFQGPLEGHRGSLGYYFLVAPALLVPWSGLLWPLGRRLRTEWAEPLPRFLLLWFGFVFAFFSLSGTKLPHYLLYGMTPVFLLLGRRLPASATLANSLVLPCALLLVLLALPAGLAAWVDAHPQSLPPLYAAQAQRAALLASAGYYAITGACAAAALYLTLWRRPAVWTRALGASTALAVALVFAFTPWLGELLQGPVRDAARVAAQRPEPAVQWNFSAPSFSVYRRRITPAREPEPGELAITRVDRLPPGVPVEVIFEEGGVALVLRKPEPASPRPPQSQAASTSSAVSSRTSP